MTVIRNNNTNPLDIFIRRVQIKEVKEFKREDFQQISEMFKANTDINVRIPFLKIYVWNITLYGCKSQKIEESERKNIEIFEMWRYRKMLKIK